MANAWLSDVIRMRRRRRFANRTVVIVSLKTNDAGIVVKLRTDQRVKMDYVMMRVVEINLNTTKGQIVTVVSLPIIVSDVINIVETFVAKKEEKGTNIFVVCLVS